MSSRNDYGSKIDPIAVIQGIIHEYPFGVGIFRELLQNSDDAKASKQIFLLDTRQHATDSLYHNRLNHTQGPALIAYNDAVFQEGDWEALQTVHQSSKKTDTSKIGKYGIGSRSCYHVTDNPQVLSNSSFAVFDLQKQFTSSGGVRIDTQDVPKDHLTSLNFEWFKSFSAQLESFRGTIIRLPLRNEKSRIKKDLVSHDDISRLFQDFIQKELDVVLLFLSSLRSIEIYVIHENDQAPFLLASTTASQDNANSTLQYQTLSRHLSTTLLDGNTRNQTWLVFHASFCQSECVNLLSERLGSDARETMEEEKFAPNVALAVPSSPQPGSDSKLGRLFTYLPLPLFTEFPCHIHGLFALDKSRQHLRNSKEQLLDKTSDRTRVEWNMFLFDTLIPRAWAQLIFTIIDLNNPPVRNIFHFWPSHSSDASEWHCVPSKLFEEVISTNKAVWPVVPSTPGGTPHHFALDEVLVSSEADTSNEDFGEQLLALAATGIQISLLPHYIYSFTGSHVKVRRLTSKAVREALLERKSRLADLSDKDRELILDYLLSAAGLETIVGLPLIPLVNNTVVSLSTYAPGCIVHVVLDADAQSLFSSLDPSAVSLSQLPPQATKLFLQKGEGCVNVKLLSCNTIISYLNMAIQNFHIPPAATPGFRMSPGAEEWFLRFWVWVPSWASAKELYPFLKSLPSLPTMKNGLQSPQNGIFLLDTLDSQVSQLLETNGVPFLHHDYPANHATRNYLQEQGSIKSVYRMKDLLYHVQPTFSRERDAKLFRKYILSPNISFEGMERAELRRLPIFHRIVQRPTQGMTTTTLITSIADDLELKCVPEDTILPIVPGLFFTPDFQLARVVDPHIQQLSEIEVLRLAIEHFPAQPLELQIAYLARIHNIREDIPEKLLQELRACAFVRTANEVLHPPAEIFDPVSEVAKLLPQDDPRFPRRDTQIDTDVVDALRLLGLFRDKFTMDLAQERIQFVAANTSRIALAEKLLAQMECQSMEYSVLGDIIHLPWLPTNEGLRRPCECRDSTNAVLCRDVLPLLKGGKAVRSPELRKALGWNMPIPLPVVVNQFGYMLTNTDASGSASQIYDIILEFGSRIGELDEDTISELTRYTSDRRWIPTSGFSHELSPTALSVFSLDSTLPVFRKVRTSLVNNPGTRKFLERMGCTQSPSNHALLQAINICKDAVKEVVAFLRALNFKELSDDERATRFVPDSDGVLRAPSELCYNDLGTNAFRSFITAEKILVHRDVDYEIAMQLKLALLSDLEIPLVDGDKNMGERLVRRIYGVLEHYTEEQAFLEFLANAADAKATKFGLYLDELLHEEKQHLLTPAMAQFQQEPSLIIYNNGVFSSKDWNGILDIGEGGKWAKDGEYSVDSQNATIGRFGLGALSMFHFTEVAMVISGEMVLFLDPTERHGLGGAEPRTARRIPLGTMQKYFPGHLAPLQGIFGFSTSTHYYPGTIFRLSLRTKQQASKKNNPISNEWRSPGGICSLLSGFYKRFAPSALLFIKIQEIYALHRSGLGHESQIWTVAAQRTPLDSQGPASGLETVVIRRSEGRVDQNIEEKWQVLVEHIPHDDIPTCHHDVMLKFHIRSVTIGIAGLLDKYSDRDRYRIFFGVPVPAYTSLPVHLHGSFIFSPERRNIRFEDDGDGGPEPLYNKWLLSERVPLVYLKFLEAWPMDRKLQESNWWPRSSPKDIISRVIIQAINRCFSTSERMICDSLEGPRVAPSACTFLPSLPPGARSILQRICPPNLAQVPPSIVRSDALALLNGQYLADILRKYKCDFRSLFSSKQVHILDVIDVVRYLVGESREESLLIGLPLIPLASGGLEIFGKPGNSPSIYTWNSLLNPLPWSLFGSEYFLQPEIDAKLMVEQGLNVSELTGDAVIKFIESRFQRIGQLDMGGEDQKWIGDVCLILEHLEVARKELSQFPLVPTYLSQVADTSTITYISLERCDSDSTIPFESDLSLPHLHAMQRLGASFVKRRDCPLKLQNFLSNFMYSFEVVLKFFATIPGDQLPTCFSPVEARAEGRFFTEWRLLAAWIRDQLAFSPLLPKHQNSLHLKEVARSLPVWKVIWAERGPFVDGIAAAQQIMMLPRFVELAVAQPFLPHSDTSQCVYAAFSEILSALGVNLLDMAAFLDLLEFPPVMTPISDAYMALLGVLISSCPGNHPIKVPNANGRMVFSSELYSRTVPLFRDAFSSRREQQKLLHPSLEHLETGTKLFRFGLRHEIKFESFLAAATALDQDTDDEDKVRRATQLYEVYNNRLYHCILGDVSFWNRLNALHFIPRDLVRRRSTLGTIPFNQFASPLPLVISPTQSLATKYESVAWTQRALFRDDPSEQLSLSNPSLGQPSIGEVIEHLRVLSQAIAPDHVFDSDLIYDLQETYHWLNNQNADVRRELLEYSQDELFLNVDDPKTDDWKWEPARNLVFDAPDEADRRSVRTFITNYKDLLLSAGAHEIKRVTVPTNVKPTPIEETFATLRSSLDDMRRNGQLTDVILKTRDGEELGAHRVILAAQSEYFRDMFTGPFEESGFIPVIEYPDYVPESVRTTLEYLYTGVIPGGLGFETLVDAFKLSDYCGLRDLNTEVQMKLILSGFITPGSYEHLLKLSQNYPDGPLTEACRDYEAKNRATFGALGLHTSSTAGII